MVTVKYFSFMYTLWERKVVHSMFGVLVKKEGAVLNADDQNYNDVSVMMHLSGFQSTFD